VLVLLGSTVYQVDQRHQALVVRFGDPVRWCARRACT
jgi:regulator of protease activity HflC (stomatin/prohibitin superfamily)